MTWVQYVVGCCLLLAPSPVLSDACSDLETAITRATTLKHEMQREAAPFVSSAQMPVRHAGICKTAEDLRTHLVMLAAQMRSSQCLNDEQYKNLAGTVDVSMKEANSNVGLFCN
jgi:hypothetical protein